MPDFVVGDKDSDLVSFTVGGKWGLFCIPCDASAQLGWTYPFVSGYGIPYNDGKGVVATLEPRDPYPGAYAAATLSKLSYSGYSTIPSLAPPLRGVKIFGKQSPNRNFSNFPYDRSEYTGESHTVMHSAHNSHSKEWVSPTGRYLVTCLDKVEVNGADKGKPYSHVIFACLIRGNSEVFALSVDNADNLVRTSVRPLNGGPDVPWTFLGSYDWDGLTIPVGTYEEPGKTHPWVPMLCPAMLFGQAYVNASGTRVVAWVSDPGVMSGYLDISTMDGTITFVEADRGTYTITRNYSETGYEQMFAEDTNYSAQLTQFETYALDTQIGAYFDEDVLRFHTYSATYTASGSITRNTTYSVVLMDVEHVYKKVYTPENPWQVFYWEFVIDMPFPAEWDNTDELTETAQYSFNSSCTIFGETIELSTAQGSKTRYVWNKSFSAWWGTRADPENTVQESISVGRKLRQLRYVGRTPASPILMEEVDTPTYTGSPVVQTQTMKLRFGGSWSVLASGSCPEPSTPDERMGLRGGWAYPLGAKSYSIVWYAVPNTNGGTGPPEYNTIPRRIINKKDGASRGGTTIFETRSGASGYWVKSISGDSAVENFPTPNVGGMSGLTLSSSDASSIASPWTGPTSTTGGFVSLSQVQNPNQPSLFNSMYGNPYMNERSLGNFSILSIPKLTYEQHIPTNSLRLVWGPEYITQCTSQDFLATFKIQLGDSGFASGALKQLCFRPF